jgi:hypothetical protein
MTLQNFEEHHSPGCHWYTVGVSFEGDASPAKVETLLRMDCGNL